MGPVYYGHIGTSQKCPDCQGILIFQVILNDKMQFGTLTKCVDYAGAKCPSTFINNEGSIRNHRAF